MNEVPLPKTPERTIIRIVSIISFFIATTLFIKFAFAVIDYVLTSIYDSSSYIFSTPYLSIQSSFPIFAVSAVVFFASLFVLKSKTIVKNGNSYSIGWLRFYYVIFTLIGLTLFGSIVTEVTSWLEGDLASRLFFKILTLAVLIYFIIRYYRGELSGYWYNNPSKHNRFLALMIVLSVAISFLSFALVGTPGFHKKVEADIQRRIDINSLSYQIECNCNNGVLPTTEEFVNDVKSGSGGQYYYYAKDSTKQPITYKKINEDEYQICAAFEYDSYITNEYIEKGYSDLDYALPEYEWEYSKGGCQTFQYSPAEFTQEHSDLDDLEDIPNPFSSKSEEKGL
jgi:hypothetical protein